MTNERAKQLLRIIRSEPDEKMLLDAGVASREEAADILRGEIAMTRGGTWEDILASPWAHGAGGGRRMNEQAKEPKRKPRGLGRVYRDGPRGTWWVDFSWRRRRYRLRAEEAQNEKQAWNYLAAQRERVRQGGRLDLERARFGDLAARLRAHHEAKGTRPRTRARYEQQIAHLERFFTNARAEDIAPRVEAYIAARRRGDPNATSPVPGAKAATIHGEVALLAQMYRTVGLPSPRLPAIEVRNVRTGFLAEVDVRAVATHLPPPLRPAAWFAYYTGWRKGEVLGLRWKAVDPAQGEVRLEPGETKNGRGRVFPFAAVPALAALLARQREATDAVQREEGRIVAHVFHRAGRPILDMDDAWRTACKAAGLPGRLFHDLRRSAALALRRAGLSETDIMELCGWETPSMFRRYCVKDQTGLAERLRRAAEAGAYGRAAAETRHGGTAGGGGETR